MRENWPPSWRVWKRNEGGYADHPRDPGGATKWGVSKRAHPNVNIAALSEDEAQRIIRDSYWHPARCDDFPSGIDLATFDASGNSGVRRGVKWTQRALGVKADGVVGSQTLAAARAAADPVAVVKRACKHRMSFLTGLGTWGVFGRGWSRRVAYVEAEASALAGASPGRLEAESVQAEGASTAQNTGAAGSGVGGGAAVAPGTGLDLPAWADVAVLVVVALVVVLLVLKARHNRNRAEALSAVANDLAIATGKG